MKNDSTLARTLARVESGTIFDSFRVLVSSDALRGVASGLRGSSL